mmetsp:Transcript_13185/g.35022  ORF Transcript_13185/g.35022 Transcript_13185/m.35022 type:complete len:247 (-) Transcript_13185:292-1032(-)
MAPCEGLLKPTASTDSVCPTRFARVLPVSMCVALHEPSSLPVTTTGPSGCAQMLTMAPSCTCLAWCWGDPVRGFHTMMARSSEAVQTSLPPMGQQPQVTPCACPAKICISFPVGAHHIHAMVSVEPARIACPFGCQDIHSTSLDGPSSACTRAPSCGVHMRTVPSYEPVATYCPSLLNATCITESVWPCKRNRCVQAREPFCSSMCHRTATSSWPPVTKLFQSVGFTITERTLSACATDVTASSTP